MRIGTFISAAALAAVDFGEFFVFVAAAVDPCRSVCSPTVPKPVL